MAIILWKHSRCTCDSSPRQLHPTSIKGLFRVFTHSKHTKQHLVGSSDILLFCLMRIENLRHDKSFWRMYRFNQESVCRLRVQSVACVFSVSTELTFSQDKCDKYVHKIFLVRSGLCSHFIYYSFIYYSFIHYSFIHYSRIFSLIYIFTPGYFHSFIFSLIYIFTPGYFHSFIFSLIYIFTHLSITHLPFV